MVKGSYFGFMPTVVLPEGKNEAKDHINVQMQELKDTVLMNAYNDPNNFKMYHYSVISGIVDTKIKNLVKKGFDNDTIIKILAIESDENDAIVLDNNVVDFTDDRRNNMDHNSGIEKERIKQDKDTRLKTHDPPLVKPVNVSVFSKSYGKPQGDVFMDAKKGNGEASIIKESILTSPTVKKNPISNILGVSDERRIVEGAECITDCFNFYADNLVTDKELVNRNDNVATFFKVASEKPNVIRSIAFNMYNQFKDEKVLNKKLKAKVRQLMEEANNNGGANMDDNTLKVLLDSNNEKTNRQVEDTKREVKEMIGDLKSEIVKGMNNANATNPLNQILSRLEAMEEQVRILSNGQAEVCNNGKCYITTVENLNKTVNERMHTLEQEMNSVRADTRASIQGINQVINTNYKTICSGLDCLKEKLDEDDYTVECSCGTNFLWDKSREFNACPNCGKKYHAET